MSCAQSLSSHVGMGSSSHDLTGDDFNSIPISASVTGSNAFSRHVWHILCAGLCVPGQSYYKSIFMVYIPNEGLEFRVQCMIWFILMQKAISLRVN